MHFFDVFSVFRLKQALNIFGGKNELEQKYGIFKDQFTNNLKAGKATLVSVGGAYIKDCLQGLNTPYKNFQQFGLKNIIPKIYPFIIMDEKLSYRFW